MYMTESKRKRPVKMRLKNLLRNSFFSLLSQFALIIIGFFSQRVVVMTMGENLVGMNSVISNIIAILSVSELGIASAIAYYLYEALAVRDEARITSLMNLYRRAYGLFALVITATGLCVMPFVHVFLKENRFPIGYVRLIYCLWLARTVLSYLLSYKRSILIADQKEYIVLYGYEPSELWDDDCDFESLATLCAGAFAEYRHRSDNQYMD